MPPDTVIEPGGIDLLPDHRLIVGSRRGEIWMVEGALATPPQPKWKLFAHGLHEMLGPGLEGRLALRHPAARASIALKDTDGDGRADVFETVSDGWGISGDYHEYAFGSQFDKDGNIWVVLCLTGSFTSDVQYRGWCVRGHARRQDRSRRAAAIRCPGGIGFNAEGDVFYTDNQGPWNGSSSLKQLKPGGFVGHPDGNRWYDRRRRTWARSRSARSEQPDDGRGQRDPRARPAGGLLPVRQDGPVGERHRLRHCPAASSGRSRSSSSSATRRTAR